MAFPEIVKAVKLQNNLNQKELALLLNVSQQNLSRWERGNASPPTEVLCMLAYRFNIPIEEVVDYKNVIAPLELTDKQFLSMKKQKDKRLPVEYTDVSPVEYSWLIKEESHKEGFSEAYNSILADQELLKWKLEHDEYLPEFKRGDELFFKRFISLKEGYCLWLDSSNKSSLKFIELNKQMILAREPKMDSESVVIPRRQFNTQHIVGYLSYTIRRY